jgi:DNA gyrase subunit A
VIVGELEDVKARYANARRTEIIAAEAEINVEDLIQEQDMVVTVSHNGYIKRTPSAEYQSQKRGGKGKIAHNARDEDFVSRLFVASTHAYVLFFTDKGKVYLKKVYEIPEASRSSVGRNIVNFVGLEAGERVAAIAPLAKFTDDMFVVTLTKKGLIKKTEATAYDSIREKGIIGVKVEDGDVLLSAEVTDGKREFLIATRQGMSIRFSEDQVRSTGRGTMGVKAITLDDADEVVGFAVTETGRDQVLTVCEKGFGKRTVLDEFRLQNRGGKGIILIDAGERNGGVVGIALIKPDDQLMVVTDRGQLLRTKVAEIRETGRNAKGVKIMSVDESERIIAIERLAEAEEEPAEATSEAVEGAETSEAPAAPSVPPGSLPPTSDPPVEA